MNLLFDFGHPAHFHLFKNSMKRLSASGHSVWVTARNKDILLKLLDLSGIQVFELKNSSNKIWNHFVNLISIHKIINQKDIDLAIGVSVLIAQASFFNRMKSIVFDDDDFKVTPWFAIMSHTFASHVISPLVLKKGITGYKYIFHKSLHELAYLHPNQFKPDEEILSQYHLTRSKPFFIIRLSALKAHHDVGEIGMKHQQALRILRLLSKIGKVLVSTESDLHDDFKKNEIFSPIHFHHLLAFSKLLVCDSQTVASEAAVLGVPSVRINTFVGRISYLEELEHKYHLTFGFNPAQYENAIRKILELAERPNDIEFAAKRNKMLSDKIDLTAFLVWLIENYPESVSVMKHNPDYQLNFR